MLNYGVIRPTMGLPTYKNDLLSRFSGWGIKQFVGNTDTVVANSANGAWIQEADNISYQDVKNNTFNDRALHYFQKNINQADNWNFQPSLPLVIRDIGTF